MPVLALSFPHQGRGSTQTPAGPRSIPLPHTDHPGQPGPHPFCHPLPPSKHLLQMGSFIPITTSLIRLYGTAASTGSFIRATATGPGPGCPPGAPGARSSLPGGPGADGRRAAVRGCRTDTGGMLEGPCRGLAVPLAPTAQDPPRNSTRAGRASAGRRAQQRRLSLLGFLPSSEIIFFPLNNHYEPFLFLT